jgi:glycosyltransferase involved in cell wall biosynthesis
VYWRRRFEGVMQERHATERPHFDATTMSAHDPARRALMHWLDERAERATTRLILDASEFVFLKSEQEGELLAEDFQTRRTKMRVTPNGIDEQFAHGDAQRFFDKHKLRNFVLCVARLDYQKNIPNLIRAWRDENIPLVLIGKSENAVYAEQCRAEANTNVYFLEPMSPSELADAYAAAKVHVLASWWDQSPRAAMEAGMAGCNLVMTENSPAREYFGDECFLCDPSDVRSIRAAIRAAYDAPRHNSFAERLRANFAWASTARVLANAYRELEKQPAPPLPETYTQQLMEIANVRAEAYALRELHYNELEQHARELKTWLRELETARGAQNRPLEMARRLFKRA